MRTFFLALSLSSALVAQSNANPGYDINMYDLYSMNDYRNGPSGSPTGTAAFTFGHAWCNGGTAAVPWEDQNPDGTMTDTYPKVSFLITRELNGRMEQISDRSFVKYSYITFNLGSSVCGTCQSSPSGAWFRVGCYDAYGAGTNASHHYLGPAEEINPWLGTWDSVGGYWDAGDPPVSGPQATDNIKSLNTSGFSSIKNRPQVSEATLMEGGTFFTQVYAIIQGEPVGNRANNIRTRQADISWNGTGWNSSLTGASIGASVLTQWSGATTAEGGNGNDDGRFCVGVNVTGPFGGLYHYEYAVHNIDNNRGGAVVRIPCDAAATVSNWGVKDIDTDVSNDWTFSRVGDELIFSAGVDNALMWNTIYNFWFDCSDSPTDGTVVIDQANPGPGAAQVIVSARVPADGDFATASNFGSGCGDCEDSFYEYFGSAGSMDLAGNSMALTLAGTSYTVGTSSETYVAPTGLPLPLSDDDTESVNLPFTLNYPGGSTTTLHVCSNGFISPAANNSNDYNPSPGDLFSGNARWAAAWHDYNPTGSSGTVKVDSSATEVRVTWDGVYPFGQSTPDTFQVIFQNDGDVHVLWQTINGTGNSFLVGWAPDGAADPGPIDLSTELGIGFGICESSSGLMTLGASNRPVLGTTIQMTTNGIPGGSLGGAMLWSSSLTNPGLDLGFIGMEGCELYGSGDLFNVPLPSLSAPVDVPFSVMSSPTFVGFEMIAQTFVIAPGLTTLGVIGSNAVILKLGN